MSYKSAEDIIAGALHWWTTDRKRAEKVAAGMNPPGRVVKGEDGTFSVEKDEPAP